MTDAPGTQLTPETTAAGLTLPLDTVAIQKIIPHRFPFLLVDRVTELVPGESATGIKNVTMNEHFFQGHFPDFPVMPGVLIVEAIAQVGAIAMLSQPGQDDKLALFAGINSVRFKRQVKPGDTLTLAVKLGAFRRGIGAGEGVATVDGEVACRGEFMFAVVPKP
ncbi:MAG TPA: 3-hydroxyacyl-ACP dehydratase FabZ [Thermomicrobiales bacterium]|jgi:3-hydroxyacyl-[acyl-carrier-protein] dehydratase|nr:3-hydroxyacyl-ACP dehydratase FabZ [Thermomicrobiales bacterium]